jgi:hypothetical protein
MAGRHQPIHPRHAEPDLFDFVLTHDGPNSELRLERFPGLG